MKTFEGVARTETRPRDMRKEKSSELRLKDGLEIENTQYLR